MKDGSKDEVGPGAGKLVELATLIGHESLDTTAHFALPREEDLASRSREIAQHRPRRVFSLAAGFLVVGLVVVEVAPGAPGAEVAIVHIGGIVIGVGDGEFDADLAGQALGVERGAGVPS